MGNEGKRKAVGWYWTSLYAPLTNEQRQLLCSASGIDGHGDKDDLRLLAYALRSYVLYMRYGIRLEHMHWAKTKHGRPFLTLYPNIDVNISHSGCMAVCAAGTMRVGTDIQRIKTRISEGLARRICTQEEWQWMQGQKQKAEALIQLWTLKESYLKWTGEGLSGMMKSFSAYEKEPGRIKTSLEGMQFAVARPVPGYCAALCTKEAAIDRLRFVPGTKLICFAESMGKSKMRLT